VDPLLGETTGLLVEVADDTDLLAEDLGVLRVGIEPVATAVRLQVGLFLTRSSRPCFSVSHDPASG
jgi:hypothetical protein